MSDNQLGSICITLVMFALFSSIGLRVWADHKEAMEDKE